MRLLLIFLVLTITTFQTVHADLGETREQLIARYGKPNIEEGNRLYFLSDDAQIVVKMSDDGKSAQEMFGYKKDIGQNKVMEILLRSSKGQAWRATDLGYPASQMVWRYTQPELNLHASYTRDDNAHDSVYYFLIGI